MNLNDRLSHATCPQGLVVTLHASAILPFGIQFTRLVFDAEHCPPPVNPLKKNLLPPGLILGRY